MAILQHSTYSACLNSRGGPGGMSWAPNPEKNNTLKKSTNEVKIFEAQYFLLFLAFSLVIGGSEGIMGSK